MGADKFLRLKRKALTLIICLGSKTPGVTNCIVLIKFEVYNKCRKKLGGHTI